VPSCFGRHAAASACARRLPFCSPFTYCRIAGLAQKALSRPFLLNGAIMAAVLVPVFTNYRLRSARARGALAIRTASDEGETAWARVHDGFEKGLESQSQLV
jgi:hypothetical protein